MRIIQKGIRFGSLNKAILYRDNFGCLKIAVQGSKQPWVLILKGQDSETTRRHFVNQFI